MMLARVMRGGCLGLVAGALAGVAYGPLAGILAYLLIGGAALLAPPYADPDR